MNEETGEGIKFNVGSEVSAGSSSVSRLPPTDTLIAFPLISWATPEKLAPLRNTLKGYIDTIYNAEYISEDKSSDELPITMRLLAYSNSVDRVSDGQTVWGSNAIEPELLKNILNIELADDNTYTYGGTSISAGLNDALFYATYDFGRNVYRRKVLIFIVSYTPKEAMFYPTDPNPGEIDEGDVPDLDSQFRASSASSPGMIKTQIEDYCHTIKNGMGLFSGIFAHQAHNPIELYMIVYRDDDDHQHEQNGYLYEEEGYEEVFKNCASKPETFFKVSTESELKNALQSTLEYEIDEEGGDGKLRLTQ